MPITPTAQRWHQQALLLTCLNSLNCSLSLLLQHIHEALICLERVVQQNSLIPSIANDAFLGGGIFMSINLSAISNLATHESCWNNMVNDKVNFFIFFLMCHHLCKSNYIMDIVKNLILNLKHLLPLFLLHSPDSTNQANSNDST